MSFLTPVHIGQLMVLRSMVNRVFRTSMEVGVRVSVEDLMTGEVRHTSSAYLTFVALDAAGKPQPIAPAIPETAEEVRRYQDAAVRRQHRLALRR
jgi:acyl-CoA hydrolase